MSRSTGHGQVARGQFNALLIVSFTLIIGDHVFIAMIVFLDCLYFFIMGHGSIEINLFVAFVEVPCTVFYCGEWAMASWQQ